MTEADPTRIPPLFWKIALPAAAVVVAVIVGSVILGGSTTKVNPEGSEVTIVDNGAPSVSEPCMRSMNEAAEVVGDNDAELLATADACGSVDEWIQALQANPGAGVLVSYSAQDAEDLLRLVCVQATSSVTCVDAASRGLLG